MKTAREYQQDIAATYDSGKSLDANIERVFEIAISDSRATALEDAARVADAKAEEWSGENCSGGDIDRKHHSDGERAAEGVATAIRALAKGER
jgi:hypothetical protein